MIERFSRFHKSVETSLYECEESDAERLRELFYITLKCGVAPDEQVVHSALSEDPLAQNIFGDAIHDVCSISYNPSRVTLWVATRKGITNSDFFAGIMERRTVSVVATHISSPHNETDESDPLVDFALSHLDAAGYIQHDNLPYCTSSAQKYRLERGLFVPAGWEV